jgi:hypothetical protein
MDIYKSPTIWDSVNTKSFLPHDKNIVGLNATVIRATTLPVIHKKGGEV